MRVTADRGWMEVSENWCGGAAMDASDPERTARVARASELYALFEQRCPNNNTTPHFTLIK